MRFLNAILIKLCLGFIVGIYVGFTEIVELQPLFFLLTGFVILLVILKWIWRSKPIFLIISILLFVVLGCLTTALHLPENQLKHFIHLDIEGIENASIQANVSEILRPNHYNHKFILDDVEIEGKAYRGKILWQVSRDVEVSKLYVGSKVLIYTKLNSFQKPKNPQYFDYAAFMNNRNLYAVINANHFASLSESDFNMNAISAEYRQNLVSALEKAGFKEKHLELMQALILGQKESINKQTYKDFAEVGIVHILAVSGLHVGIVLLIIQFLLKPIRRFPKYGRPMVVILSIIALWCFAAIAGFSPSVMRASTMFSFLALSQLSRRKTNSVNMLCLSAVVLLLLKPQFLFEVGFQLSYAAVFSIVMLYPVFSKLYQPKFKIPKIFVDTAYVSIAAQIGVLPFQLFYFHQFPGLFLLGNMVVIPFLGILLSGGILCIVLALSGFLIPTIVDLYSYFLDSLLAYVDWLSQFKSFVFQDLFFTQPMFVALIILAIAFNIMIREFQKTRIFIFLCAALIFSAISVFEILKKQKLEELIIFHKSKQTLVGVKDGQKLNVYSDSLPLSQNTYLIQNYSLLNRIKDIRFDSLRNFYKLKDSKLVIVDSSGIYMDEPKGEIVLLSGSPDIHFEKLLKQLVPRQIIVDGNNYKSYVERWQETAEELDILFHNTYHDGSINFSLK